MSARRSMHDQSMMVAFCGVFSALSVVLMLAGGIIPIATYVAPLAAGILLIPVATEYGNKAAWTVWLATTILVLLLGIDKEAAFFYLFLGYYPLLKPIIDRNRKPGLRLLIKLLYFILAVGIMYGFLCLILHVDAVSADFADMGRWMTAAFFVLMLFCLLVYDVLLGKLVIIYRIRLQPKLSFLRRH